jgi:hydrogenase nickel incorporation protein HypA/HybF
MHELSLADAVVRIACAHAGGRRIESIELKVGHLRQVVPDALAFAFTLVAAGTEAEGAALLMEEVPAAGICRGCGTASEFEAFPLACSACESLDVELVRGEELLVDAVTMATSSDSPCETKPAVAGGA